MNKIILKYLGQASTYKGLFTLLAACGVTLSGDLSNAVAGVCLAVVGLINVLMDEKRHK